jgi:heterodisulfide reductase subunit B
MRYAFFLGCLVPNRYPGIEVATRETFSQLGITLEDIEGASCCPAPGVVGSFDAYTWLALGARNLALAESMGCDIITICNGCFETLFEVNKILKEDAKLRGEINDILANAGRRYDGTIAVRHLVEVLRDFGVDRIEKTVKKPLHGLNVAIHYGCHLLRPSRIKQIDDPVRPVVLDKLVESLGAKSVSYENRMMCCGAGGGVRSAYVEFSLEFTREKLRAIKAAGSDCIVDVCPFCHLQYDRGQIEIQKIFGEEYRFPVIHYSQLLGLAMGMDPEKLGLYAQEVSCEPVLEKIR